ncbi:integrase core domain-containing protein [Candidatus Accumulibacter phosphatis]
MVGAACKRDDCAEQERSALQNPKTIRLEATLGPNVEVPPVLVQQDFGSVLREEGAATNHLYLLVDPLPGAALLDRGGLQMDLEELPGIRVVISMEGRGRVFNNILVERLWRSVKYEDVYLKGCAAMSELMVRLAEYFAFHNGERPHQSLHNATPESSIEPPSAGGAFILDKFDGAGGKVTCAT